MATTVKIVMNPAAVREVLQAVEVQADMDRRGKAIAAAAGEGFDVLTTVGRTRARTTVMTATVEAQEAEATDRALTRAIDAGR